MKKIDVLTRLAGRLATTVGSDRLIGALTAYALSFEVLKSLRLNNFA